MRRGIDILISAVLLVLLPFFAAIALLITLTSPGPVFYRWHVLGIHGRPFVGYKFRTMVEHAADLKPHLLEQNEMKGPVFTMTEDPRVTRLGRVLRTYSLDELPQLWSVLTGEMSLVGPHPPLQTEGERFAEWHWRTLRVTPGITCLWQINGRHEITDFDEWVRLDLEYIATRALWLDLKILLKTLPSPEGCCRSTVKFALTYGFCHEATARVSGRRESTRGLMRRDCTGASFPTSI